MRGANHWVGMKVTLQWDVTFLIKAVTMVSNVHLP